MCDTCKNKVIFGGEGSSKEELCLNKICLKVDIMEVSVQSEGDVAANRGRQRNHKRVEFTGTPLRVDDSQREVSYMTPTEGGVEGILLVQIKAASLGYAWLPLLYLD